VEGIRITIYTYTTKKKGGRTIILIIHHPSSSKCNINIKKKPKKNPRTPPFSRSPSPSPPFTFSSLLSLSHHYSDLTFQITAAAVTANTTTAPAV